MILCQACRQVLKAHEVEAEEYPPKGTHARGLYCDPCWARIAARLRGPDGPMGLPGIPGRDGVR